MEESRNTTGSSSAIFVSVLVAAAGNTTFRKEHTVQICPAVRPLNLSFLSTIDPDRSCLHITQHCVRKSGFTNQGCTEPNMCALGMSASPSPASHPHPCMVGPSPVPGSAPRSESGAGGLLHDFLRCQCPRSCGSRYDSVPAKKKK